jgi:DNA polymerase III sliding clamp (beta) subunit (PCNA family)
MLISKNFIHLLKECPRDLLINHSVVGLGFETESELLNLSKIATIKKEKFVDLNQLKGFRIFNKKVVKNVAEFKLSKNHINDLNFLLTGCHISRLSLKSFNFNFNKDNLEIATTNGSTLNVISYDITNEYKGQFLVHSDFMKFIIKELKNNDITMYFSEEYVSVIINDTIHSMKLIDEEFPRYKSVISTKNIHNFTLDKNDFIVNKNDILINFLNNDNYIFSINNNSLLLKLNDKNIQLNSIINNNCNIEFIIDKKIFDIVLEYFDNIKVEYFNYKSPLLCKDKNKLSLFMPKFE